MSEEAEVEEVAVPEESVEAESVETEETEEVEEESAPSEPEKPKKKGGFQKRIDELTREKYEAQEAARVAQQQYAEMQRHIQEQRLQQAGDIPFPDPSEFEDVQTYQQAVMSWNNQKRQAEDQARQQQAQQYQEAQRQREAAIAINAKIAKATEKYPDWNLKVQDPSLPPLSQISPAAYQAVLDSDDMGDVAYYLANNPSEVYRFRDLSPLQAIKEVARIEMTIKGQSKSASAPPPPPTKVTSHGETEVNPAKMTTDEYIAWRNSKDPRLKR